MGPVEGGDYTVLMLIRDLTVSLASMVASVSAAIVAWAVAARYRYDRREHEEQKRNGHFPHER